MVMIVGHRGARNLWPENSLAGFRASRGLGVDAVEFDVHQTRRRRARRHPRSAARAHDRMAPGRSRDRTVAELDRPRAARRRRANGVPTLDAVLDVYPATRPRDAHRDQDRRLRQALSGPGADGWSTSCSRRGLEQQRHPHLLRARGAGDRAAAIAAGAGAGLARPPLGRDDGRRLPPALDRFAAIGDCIVAVEKALLADASPAASSGSAATGSAPG